MKKIVTPQKLKPILEKLKKQKKKIVFTNGCFDILHAGHVRYLAQAKKCGDILVVGLNTDQSVKKIKGSSRPIVSQEERAEVIAGLEVVDFITFFDEDNPYKLIATLKPNVLVKGGDWKINQIIGSDIVLKNGGEVKSLRYHKGRSTTNIIENIRST